MRAFFICCLMAQLSVMAEATSWFSNPSVAIRANMDEINNRWNSAIGRSNSLDMNKGKKVPENVKIKSEKKRGVSDGHLAKLGSYMWGGEEAPELFNDVVRITDDLVDKVQSCVQDTKDFAKRRVSIEEKCPVMSAVENAQNEKTLQSQLAKAKVRKVLESGRGGAGSSNKRKVLILMSDTGGGHRASAQALDYSLQQQYPGKIDVDIMDIWTDHANWPFNRFVPMYVS